MTLSDERIVHSEFVNLNVTLPTDTYVRQLQDKLEEKCPVIVNRKSIVLPHDNA